MFLQNILSVLFYRQTLEKKTIPNFYVGVGWVRWHRGMELARELLLDIIKQLFSLYRDDSLDSRGYN